MTDDKNSNITNFLAVVETNLATTLSAKAAALPDGFQSAKFQQNCIAMLKGIKKTDLMKVQPEDVVSCLMKAALLDLDFASGECYALPYWNKDEGKNDLNFQTDYKGEDKIAKTFSIKPINNTIKEIVREGDKYQKVIQGGNVYFNFEPIPFNNGKIIGAFAQVTYTDGSSIGDDMSFAELEKLRTDFSKAANSPAWTKTPGEMYKKTIFRRVLKNVPKSFKNSAQQIAYSTATDFEFNNQVGTATNSEAIRNPFQTATPQIAKIQNEPISTPVNETFISEGEIIPEEVQTSNAGQSGVAEYGYEEVEPYYECSNCGSVIDGAVNDYSKRFYNRPLCRNCQTLAKNGEI